MAESIKKFALAFRLSLASLPNSPLLSITTQPHHPSPTHILICTASSPLAQRLVALFVLSSRSSSNATLILQTLLIWGGLEALLGGLVWQSYRRQPTMRCVQMLSVHLHHINLSFSPSPALIQASKRTQKS